MRKIILLLITSFCGAMSLSAQDAILNKNPIAIQAGYTFYMPIKTIENAHYVNFDNLSINLYLPTKYDNIDWLIGTTYVVMDKDDHNSIEGLGIYGGLSMCWWDFLTAELCAGFYPMQYEGLVESVQQDVKFFSSSIGGSASLGVKLGWESVYFNPQITLLYAGGDARFTFWGIKIPLTITF